MLSSKLGEGRHRASRLSQAARVRGVILFGIGLVGLAVLIWAFQSGRLTGKADIRLVENRVHTNFDELKTNIQFPYGGSFGALTDQYQDYGVQFKSSTYGQDYTSDTQMLLRPSGYSKAASFQAYPPGGYSTIGGVLGQGLIASSQSIAVSGSRSHQIALDQPANIIPDQTAALALFFHKPKQPNQATTTDFVKFKLMIKAGDPCQGQSFSSCRVIQPARLTVHAFDANNKVVATQFFETSGTQTVELRSSKIAWVGIIPESGRYSWSGFGGFSQGGGQATYQFGKGGGGFILDDLEFTAHPDLIVTKPTVKLSATPASLARGSGSFTVKWEVGAGNTDDQDWIGMYPANQTDNHQPVERFFTKGKTSGELKFTSDVAPDQYVFRYLIKNGFEHVAESGPVSVTDQTTPTEPHASTTLTPNDASDNQFNEGEVITITLTNLGPDQIIQRLNQRLTVWERETDQLVRTIQPTDSPNHVLAKDESYTWTWDQKNDNGELVPPGNYLFRTSYVVGDDPEASQRAVTRTGSAVIVQTELRATLQTSKSNYRPGETVKWTLTNTGQRPLKFACEPIFQLFNSEGEAIGPILERACVPSPGAAVTIEPGASLSGDWNQRDKDNQQVPSGSYFVKALELDLAASFSITDQEESAPFTVSVTPSQGEAPLMVTGMVELKEGSINRESADLFTWDFGDGSIYPNDGPIRAHIYFFAGSYTVTVRDSTGRVATTGPIEVRANQGGGQTKNGQTASGGQTQNGQNTSGGNGATQTGTTSGPTVTSQMKANVKPATLVSTGASLWFNLLVALLLTGGLAYILFYRRPVRSDDQPPA